MAEAAHTDPDAAAGPSLHVVLFQPEIPQNTGNIGRMCAISKTRLHLIHPLGFSTDSRFIRRSGLDYWEFLDVCEHSSWDAFRESEMRPRRLWLLTTKAERTIWSACFKRGDGLVFGRESAGAPDWLHDELSWRRITIPQFEPRARSLNLSTAAGIATYEVLRQLNQSGWLAE